MAQTVRIMPSVTFVAAGGESVTIEELQLFIETALSIGAKPDTPLPVTISPPYHYDQRDSSPGSFTITASPS